ncbi:MAG TPA: hypothetical protein VH969_06245 [Actinophytocola sp.]|uniref:hypothetical protein n=1 Tax=Actinophytocola sp. TaxID=1872138 RepID=UPI002F956DC8
MDLYISRETPASVLKSLVGLMTFAGLLGTIFGNEAIRVGAFVVVIFFAVCVILLLLGDRRRLQQENRAARQLVSRYCDFVVDNASKPLVSITAWDQVVYVQPNGDVREIITIKAVALRKKVYFIRMTAGSRWDQPERYRRNVRVIARGLTVNNRTGPHWLVTNSWMSSQKMVSILHLHEPIALGEEVLFEVIRMWPAKCRPLMRDDIAESFVFRTSHLLDIKHVEYKVVLPAGYDAVHEPIGHIEPDVRFSVEEGRDQEGRRVFIWHADLVPAGKTVGFRLELSESSTLASLNPLGIG